MPFPLLKPKEREIFEAAARVFFAKGFATARNQDIAQEVGMLKGSLYYYIDTKEDLLFGVMRMAYESLQERLAENATVEGNALDRLRHFVRGHTAFVIENLISIAVLERELRSLSEERRREVIGWRDGYEAYLRDLIRIGQDEGVVTGRLGAETMSIMIFTQIHGLHIWMKPHGRISGDQIVEVVAEFVTSGLSTKTRS